MIGLSQTSGYAILALACLPDPDGRPMQVKDVASTTGIAKPYLSKIIHALGQAGLVETRRGNKGGVLLSRPAADITLLEIVYAVESPHALDRCMMGLEECSDDRACPTHEFWKTVKKDIQDELAHTTLDRVAEFEMARGTRERFRSNGENVSSS